MRPYFPEEVLSSGMPKGLLMSQIWQTPLGLPGVVYLLPP